MGADGSASAGTEAGSPRLVACTGVALLVVTLISGLSYPLGKGGELAVWPWSRQWFMFANEDGFDRHLLALGTLPDGREAVVPTEKRFAERIGRDGDRMQEIERTAGAMGSLAEYLCAQFPEYDSISIEELSWAKGLPRLDWKDVSANDTSRYVWVERRPCH